MKKYAKRIILVLILFLAIPLAVIYIWSSIIINRTYSVPFTKLQIPTDTASVYDGERLLDIEHCNGCHGKQFSGRAIDTTSQALIVAPNISKIVPEYSNEELERLIRHGIKKSGKSVFFMPSYMYYGLKDESVSKIIAYLRTIKPVPAKADLPSSTSYFFMGRLKIIQGKNMPMAARILESPPKLFTHHDTSQVSLGRYLVMTACSGCHGADLKGRKEFAIPNLIIASAYNKDQFFHLLKTGEGGLGRKSLGLMSEMGKNQLCHFNDQEMNALYAFLQTLPSQKN